MSIQRRRRRLNPVPQGPARAVSSLLVPTLCVGTPPLDALRPSRPPGKSSLSAPCRKNQPAHTAGMRIVAFRSAKVRPCSFPRQTSERTPNSQLTLPTLEIRTLAPSLNCAAGRVAARRFFGPAPWTAGTKDAFSKRSEPDAECVALAPASLHRHRARGRAWARTPQAITARSTIG